MSAIIKQLTDKEGANDLLPITNTKAVYDDEGNRLDNTLTNLTNLVNNKASANLVSDAYNPSKTYAQSEFCIYNNTLWKSKVNNNAGNTPAEGSYWTATNVGSEINDRLGKKYSFNSIAISAELTVIDISALSGEIRYSRYKNILVSFIDQNQTEAYAIGSAVAYGDYWRVFCHSNKVAYFTINLICY